MKTGETTGYRSRFFNKRNRNAHLSHIRSRNILCRCTKCMLINGLEILLISSRTKNKFKLEPWYKEVTFIGAVADVVIADA